VIQEHAEMATEMEGDARGSARGRSRCLTGAARGPDRACCRARTHAPGPSPPECTAGEGGRLCANALGFVSLLLFLIQCARRIMAFSILYNVPFMFLIQCARRFMALSTLYFLHTPGTYVLSQKPSDLNLPIFMCMPCV
jgi:hypothetical protein